jgi:hypothetical protein
MMRLIVTRLRNLVSPDGTPARVDAGEAGTLHLIVKSRKVMVRMVRVEAPQFSLADLHGRVYTTPGFVPVFDYELGEDQLKLLTESRELAERTGLRLEVTDLTRQSPFKRLVMRLGGGVPGAVLRPSPGKDIIAAAESPLFRR